MTQTRAPEPVPEHADAAADPPPSTSPRSTAAFVVVAATLALLLIGPNLPTPLYPLYRHSFGFSALTITAIYAVYAGSLLPALLVFGSLSDAIGRRRVIYTAVALGIAGSAVLAAATSLNWLIAGRLLQGLSIGAGSGAATAALRECEPNDNRPRAATAASAAMVGGSAIGPILAGVLVQYAPAPRHLSFIVHIALLVAAGISLRLLSEPARHGRWRPQRPGVPASMRALFAGAGATAFLVWAVTALFLALIPSFIVTAVHTSNAAVAGAVVTLMLAGSAAVQLTGRSLPPVPAQITGLIGVVAGLIVLNSAGSSGSVTLLLIAAVVAGLGQGAAFLGAMKDINLAAPPDRLGEVVSSFYVVVYLGVGVPVIGVGVLATHIDLLAAVRGFSIVVGAAALALALVLTATQIRRRREPASPS